MCSEGGLGLGPLDPPKSLAGCVTTLDVDRPSVTLAVQCIVQYIENFIAK